MADDQKIRVRLGLYWRVKKPPEKSPKWGVTEIEGSKPSPATIVRFVYMDAGYSPEGLRDLFSSEAKLADIHAQVMRRMESERKKAGFDTAYMVRCSLAVVTDNPVQTHPQQVVLAYDDYWHRDAWADKYKKGGWMIEKSALGKPRWEDYAGPEKRVVKVQGHERKWPSKNPGANVTDNPLTWAKARTDDELRAVYRKWHWGVGPDIKVHWPDPDYPDNMIEIGRLWEMHLIMPDGKKRVLEVEDGHKNECYAVFDPAHKHQRIYLLCSKPVRQAAQAMFWDNSDQRRYPMAEAARIVGGHHGEMRDYAKRDVKLVGALSDLVYRTHKKGDDDHMRGSSYIHELGEESGKMPGLFVDARGRFWIIGGNYTCPVPGITD